MSGSNSKNERRELEREKRSQIERQRAEEERKEKMRAKIYIAIGVIVAIVIVALLIWNSGIWKKDSVAVTIGEHEYSVSETNYYYLQSRQTETMYAYYGMSSYDSTLADDEQFLAATEEELDEEGNVVTEAQDAQSYQEYFRESAVDSLKWVTVWYDAAVAAGYQMPDAAQSEIDSALASVSEVARQNGISKASYYKQVYGEHMTEKLFTQILERYYLAYYYYQEFPTSQEVPEEEIDSYYEENAASYDKFNYNVYTVDGTAASTTDDEGNTVEPTEEEQALALEAAEMLANAVVADIEAGASFHTAASTYDSAEDAEADEDYYYKSGVSLSGITPLAQDWFSDSSRSEGDVTTVLNGTTYYVFEYLERYRDDLKTNNIRHILIKAETTDYYTDENGVEQVYVAPEEPAEDYEEPEIITKPSEEQWATALAEIERIEQEWLEQGGTEEQFAALAEQYSDDTGSNTNGGLYENVASGSFVTVFEDWMFESGRATSDYAILQNESDGSYFGYHLAYYVSDGEPTWRTSIRSTLQNEKTNEWYEAQELNYEVVTDESAMVQVGV